MLNSTVVSVAVGMILVYGMLSAACSLLNERIQSVLDKRARMLEIAMQRLLGDEREGGPFAAVKDHALIRAIAHSPKAMPSYLPASTFTQALFDALVPADGEHPLTFKRLRDAILRLPDRSHVKEALLTLANSAENDVVALRADVEKWFDNAMDRLSGVYKRHVTIWLFVLGLVIAAVTNTDSVMLVQRLEHEAALRATVTSRAEQAAAQQPLPGEPTPAALTSPTGHDRSTGEVAPATPKLLADTTQLDQLDLLFWDTGRMTRVEDAATYPRAMRQPEWSASWLWWLVLKLTGLVISALAVSLGAPFWFDVLGRLVSMRATGARPAQASSAS